MAPRPWSRKQPGGLFSGAACAGQYARASRSSTAAASGSAVHRDAGLDDPTAHEGVRRVLKGLGRQAAGRGRGQAQGLTADDVAGIIATAHLPRRTGRGMESDEVADERGAVDKAIVALLFQGGLRRSEAAALTWADVADATDGAGIRVTVRRSKTDQTGERADVRYLKNGCAQAVRMLRDRRTVQALLLGGLNGQSSRAGSPQPRRRPASPGGSPGTPAGSGSPRS